MNTSKVIAPLGGTVLLVTMDEVLSGDVPRPRIYLAFGFLVVVVGIMADSAPQVAVPIAWLVFVAVLLSRGTNVLAKFAVGSSSKTKFKGGGGGSPGKPSGASGKW